MSKTASIKRVQACFLITLFILACVGCQEEPTRHVGYWIINPDDQKRDIEEKFQGETEEIKQLRKDLIDSRSDASWRFNDDGTYVRTGAFNSNGRYRIYDFDEDWVILRLLPMTIDGLGDLDDYKALNKMSEQELIQHEGIKNGSVPLLIGFRFASNNQIREFSIKVRDGKMTDEWNDSTLYDKAE